jgi:hypothetical protein
VVHISQHYIILTSARLKRDTAIADLEAAAKVNDREKLVGRVPQEGDLFGVRAIQHGYFGGVAQSRDGSPAPSNYAMSYKSGHNASSSIASSLAEYPYPRSQNLSVTSLPRRPEPTKQFPSPLRLHPSDTQSIISLGTGPIDTTASVGGKGGAYIPPLSAPRALGRDSPAFGEKPWVSPLDVHFSRPSTPKTQPASVSETNLPKPNFPGQVEKSGLVPTPAGSLFGAQSEIASIVSSSTPASGMPSQEILASKQPIVAANPSQVSTQPVENPSPFDFAFSSSQQEFRPPASQLSTDKFAPEQPLLLNNLPQQFSSIDPNLFPQQPTQRNTSTAVIRNSIVSKQRVSIHRPAHSKEHVPETPATVHRRNSSAGSSIYSAHEDVPSSPVRAATPEVEPQPSPELPPRSAARDRSRSTSTGRKSIARTHDSIRLTSKKSLAQQSLTPPTDNKNKRHSRERDSMHYDPSQTRRTRSSSIQGRAIDFDHPRESPFSNAHSVASSHSTNSSVSSSATTTPRIGSTSEPFALKVPSVSKPDLPIMTFEQVDRLSVNVLPFRQHKGKTPSETSQNSIGDFYDAYYRNSTMAQRASQMTVPLPMPPVDTVSIGGGSNTRRAAPAPLRLGPGSVGGGGLAVETIMEVATPNVSPLPERRGGGQTFI